MIDRPDNVNVFILYAAEDEDLKGELESHLSMLHRHGYIDVWHEGQVIAGEARDEVISEYLAKSHIILLLISSNFLAPDCYGRYEKELRLAYDRQKEGKVKIIPVILRHCIWEMDILAGLDTLPPKGQPVRSSYWEYPDRAYEEIAKGLRKIADGLLAIKPAPSEAPKAATPPPQPEVPEVAVADIKPPPAPPSTVQMGSRDEVAEELINNLFSFFRTLDENTCAKMAVSFVHKSQLAVGELHQNFLKYKFLKAYQRAELYQVPVKIECIKPTKRTSIGTRDQKEVGEEVMYEISRKKDIGALPGHVRIFFPASGDLAKISNLSL